MKRILVSLALALVPFGIAWIAAMEFVRGPDLAGTVVFSIFMFVAAYTCPYWWDE